MKANEERWLVKRINLARLTRLGHSPAIQVYAYLIGRCDVEGVCFPSFNTIAQQTGLSLRTVYRVMQVLERISALKKRQVTGHLHKYDFVINLDLLGADMSRAYLSEWAQCQGKVCRNLPEVCVSETQNSVSETKNCVSETNPPHPLIGVRTMEGPKKLFADLPSAKKSTVPEQRGGLVGEFYQAFRDDAASRNQTFVWSGFTWKRAKQLSQKAPDLTGEKVRRLLAIRARSDVNLAQEPVDFILQITKYEFGPLDRWGNPKGESNESHRGYSASSRPTKADISLGALHRAGLADSLSDREVAGSSGAGSADNSGPGNPTYLQ